MAVALWTLLPLLVIHVILAAWIRRAFPFQLLLDLVLIGLFGTIIVRGLDLNPVRCLETAPPFVSWTWQKDTALQPTQSDVVLQLHPWWAEARRQILAGHFPAIAPHIGGGVPLAANGQCGVLAPVMLPVWVLGPERGTTVMAVWKVEAAGLGMFLFLAVGWRLRRWSAALGGVLWGAGPFILGWLLSPLAWSLAALPWVWWLVAAGLRGRLRWGRVIGGAAALGWFMGAGINPETAAIATGSALLAGFVLHPRRWVRLLLIAGVAASVTIALAFPMVRTIAASSKAKSYAAANPNLGRLPVSMRIAAAEQLLVPMVHGNPGYGTWRGPYPYAAGAIGIGGVGIIALLAGGIRRRHRRYLAAALSVLGLAAILAFRIPPLDGLLVRLPVLRFMTLPRFALLIPWGVSLWAVLAFDGFLAGHRRPRAAWIGAALLLGLTIVLVGPGSPASVWLLALTTVAAAIAALMVLSTRPGLLPWIAAAELVVIGFGINPAASPADRLPAPPVLARLEALSAARPGRISGVDGVLPPNIASRYGLADLRSFDPVRPWPLARLHALLGATDPVLPGPLDRAPPHLLGAWSVRYLVTPAKRRAPGWTLVDSGDGIRVWENPFWQPQIRVVGTSVSLPEKEGWRLLAKDPAMLTDGVVLPPGAGQANAAHRSLEVRVATPSRVEAVLTCDGPCLLFVARPWAPGWTATVDGRRATVLRADLAALGVMSPAGRHHVCISYRLY